MFTKLFPRRALLLLAFGVLAFFSCQKLIDIIHAGDGGVEFKLCNIKKITTIAPFEPDPDTIHYVFTYNSNGDPLRITNNQVETGNPNFFFRYDKYHRLSQTIKPYLDGLSYETFDKYVYNDKNQIVIDTGYAFGPMSGDTALGDPNLYAVTLFTYDAQNRIIHSSAQIYHFGVPSFAGESDYPYNAAGNISTRLIYDDKLNINRTSKVWMFLTKDYSVNNPFIATKYNLKNLPTQVPHGIQLFALQGNQTIEYSCP